MEVDDAVYDDLKQRLEEYESSFKLYHNAIKELTEEYRKGYPNRGSYLSDVGVIASWAVYKLNEQAVRIDKLEGIIRHIELEIDKVR